MKVAVTVMPGKIEFAEREVPRISATQVLLKMKYVGICGSDIHIYQGRHPFVGPECYPLVQGHEGVAVVEQVGGGVEGFLPGDVVTIMPQLVCGRCDMCLSGNPHVCETLKVIGCQTDGLFAEKYAVDQSMLIKLPPSMDMKKAAMIEPLAVAVGAVRKLGSLAGKKVLVFGAGVIGNLCAQVARACGAEEVKIVDLDETRLRTAVDRCGVDKSEAMSKIQDKKEAFGDADFILECIGNESTLADAIRYAKKKAKILVVGVFGKDATLPMALVQDRELTLQGSLMYEREDYVGAINFIDRKAVALDPLIYKTIPFAQYDTAYKLIADNKGLALKVLVEI